MVEVFLSPYINSNLQTAKNYCSSLKRNTYLNYKKASVTRSKWRAFSLGDNAHSNYHSQFDYFEKGILVEDKTYACR